MKNLSKKIRVFVDMDGTIADIHSVPDWWEKSHEESDFFEKLEPFTNLIAALFLIKLYYGDLVEINSLSAVEKDIEGCPTEESKDKWLDAHAIFIEKKNRFFSPMGARKADYVGNITKYDILLDDYSKNLTEWEDAGGTAIKIRNNINCTRGQWQGKIIYNQDAISSIVVNLDNIIKNLA